MLIKFFSTVIQWITSCHEGRMATRVISYRCVDVTIMTTSVSTMRFLAEKNVNFVGD